MIRRQFAGVALLALLAGCSGQPQDSAPTTDPPAKAVGGAAASSSSPQTSSDASAVSGAGSGVEADAAAAAAGAWFRDVAAEVGVDFEHVSGHVDRPYFPEIMGGGVALLDFDGDGHLDIYLVQSGSVLAPGGDDARNRLYRNRGDGTFVDVTDGSCADDRGYGMGAVLGDYDNDGDPDLYVTNWGPNALLRNDGGGKFTDVTAEAGVSDGPRWGTSATFADLDADGDLDLFIANYVDWTVANEIDCPGVLGELDYCLPTNYNAPGRDTLFRNNGDGTFTDATEAAGMTEAFGYGLGTVIVDFDGDGRLDVFVANDTVFNQLWINQGGLTFLEDGLLRGCAVDEDGFAKAGMGVAAIDYDDDADRDLLVVNLVRQSDSYYENDGGFFFDRSVAVGLGAVPRAYTRFGVGFADFNLDGWLDLYEANGRVVRAQEAVRADDPYAEPNVLFAGGPDRVLREVSPAAGTVEDEAFTSRGTAFGDLDGDGDLDIVVANRGGPAKVYRNVVADRGNWIAFDPREATGRAALNAVVTVQLGDRTITRDCLSGYSYQAASDPRVWIGLGDASRVESVTVTWVDGVVERFDATSGGTAHVLHRGQGDG